MDKKNYDTYVDYIRSQEIIVEKNLALYPSGMKFTIPNSMNHYHSTTQQDVIPLSIRANYIEDIFNLFLQELITGGQGLIGKKEREEQLLPATYGKLFREVREFQRLKGEDALQENFSLWLSENFNAITDSRLRQAIKDNIGNKRLYEEMDKSERLELFEKLPIAILEPSHLLFVKAYPSENAQRYGKWLFSMLAETSDMGVGISLLERIRTYFIEEEQLDFETRLILQYLKSKIDLDVQEFDEYKNSHLVPFCPSHASLLRDDLNALFKLEKKLQRSYFIRLLYQVISMHLITYVIRVLKAIRYWIKETRKQIRQGTDSPIEELQDFRSKDYDLTHCRFSPNIKLYCGPVRTLKTTHPIFDEFSKDLDLLQASGMDFVFLDIARLFLKEAKKVKKNDIPSMEDFLTAYKEDAAFKEFVEYSAGLMAAYYLDWMQDLKNRKKSKYSHGNSNYWKVLRDKFWLDIKNPEISNFEVLLSLIEKHNATRKNDRETSFSWKMAYYRQFKEAGSIIQEIKRGKRSAIGYLATDEFLTLTVHLAAIQNKGNVTLEQYEQYLNKRGILISDNKKDSDQNRVDLKKRLKDLGMFETVSDSKEAQFINTIYL